MNDMAPLLPSSASAVSRPTASWRLVAFRPARPGTRLVGHADIAVGGLTFHDIPLFRGADGTLAAGVPSAPVLDAEGRQRVQSDSRKQWRPLFSFNTSDARLKWQQGVLDALAAGGLHYERC